MRYFIDISYHGEKFSGWQTQYNTVTVQQEIEKWLSTILRTKTKLVGSGRTDSGVHAIQQVAHFDSENEIDTGLITYSLNNTLTKSVSINSIYKVNEKAHARFSAISRTYRYVTHQFKNPFKTGLSYYFKLNLNIFYIHKACKIIEKTVNFQSFCKTHSGTSHYQCNIHYARWQKTNNGYLFEIKANRFLRGMVRLLVGALIEVGLNRMTLEQFQRKCKLETAHFYWTRKTVPPEGLYLLKVEYPPEIYLF